MRYVLLLFIMIMVSCQPKIKEPRVGNRHMAELRKPGFSLYVDKISNKVVMTSKDKDATDSQFCSYLVGFEDSSFSDQKTAIKNEKYFEYDMYKNWCLLSKGDSLQPVFFQPKTGLDSRIKEGVLVFEVGNKRVSDTMVYKDSYGSWGIVKLIIK